MKINKRQIAQTLRDCTFDPREQWKEIAEVGDPFYYQQRAVELIRSEVPRARTVACVEALQQAIGLLALAIVDLKLKAQEVSK